MSRTGRREDGAALDKPCPRGPEHTTLRLYSSHSLTGHRLHFPEIPAEKQPNLAEHNAGRLSFSPSVRLLLYAARLLSTRGS